MRIELGEKTLTLEQACQLIPGRPHKNTVRRWGNEGFRGIRLRIFRSGQKVCTSREAILEFLAAINGDSPAPAANPEHDQAESQLEAMGV